MLELPLQAEILDVTCISVYYNKITPCSNVQIWLILQIVCFYCYENYNIHFIHLLNTKFRIDSSTGLTLWCKIKRLSGCVVNLEQSTKLFI